MPRYHRFDSQEHYEEELIQHLCHVYAMNTNLWINDVYLRNAIVHGWIWHEYANEFMIKKSDKNLKQIEQILGYNI